LRLAGAAWAGACDEWGGQPAEAWKKTALEELVKCEPASRSEFANQMLLACAEMLEYKLKNSSADDNTKTQVGSD
jgi:hypothetical protein